MTLQDAATAPPGRGAGRAARINPQDREQLAQSPVALRRITGLFHHQRLRMVVVLAIIVLTATVSMAQPFLVRTVIDDALPRQNTRLLALAVAGMIAVAVITGLLGVVQTWLSTVIGQQVMHNLRTDVFTHLQRQSMSFFKRTRSGEIQSRLSNDIAGMQSVVTTTATSIASNLTTAVATAAAMAALSWRLSLVSLVVIPPAVWLTRQVALIRRDVTGQMQRQLADLQQYVDESLSVSGALLTKTLGSQQVTVDRYATASRHLVDLELRSQLAGRWRMATMQIVFAAIPALLYLAAGLPATSAGMSIGTLVAFTSLQASIFRPIMGLLNVGAQVVASMALFSRIFEYLDLPVEVPEPVTPRRIVPEAMRGEVTIEHVTAGHPDASEPVLQDVDVHVPAGAALAIIGPTGAGKSTLAGLVSRLQDPWEGRVLIDGVDVREMSSTDLASLVGVVNQETYLLHASIRDNLLLARPRASDDDLWRALEVAQISALVAGLPDGLDTVVGARGFRFSGGEKQRLAIARTILRDPRVLVLDEATSALDVGTERAVQAAIDNLSRGRTTITIAHRLSTIAGADHVIELAGGRICRQGTPAELGINRVNPDNTLNLAG